MSFYDSADAVYGSGAYGTASFGLVSGTVSLTGVVDTGDTYTISLNGVSYTSTNTVSSASAALSDIESQLSASFDTTTGGGANNAFITISSQVAGTYFSLTTNSDDADNGATIGSTMTSANYNLNVCDSDIQTLFGQNATSYRFYVNGSLIPNETGTEDQIILNSYLGNNNLIHIVILFP